MLHVLQLGAGPSSHEALRVMFAARKQVFVDLLKWQLSVVDGRYEVDEHDDQHAVYLILTDQAGGHLASARLLPTTRPHILGNSYAGLCDGPVPRGETIFEITRFCLERGIGARERRLARDTLVRALAEHALEAGISQYSAVAEGAWLRQILRFGWRSRRLGRDQEIGGETLGALAIEIAPDTPRLLAAAGIESSLAMLAARQLAAA